MTNAKYTEYLLKSISQRLSSREDCKGVTYSVKIDSTGIHMYPLVKVFPNRYRRKEADKMDIISYVHYYKMSNIGLDQFVFGTYEYQVSTTTNRRKWRKLNET